MDCVCDYEVAALALKLRARHNQIAVSEDQVNCLIMLNRNRSFPMYQNHSLILFTRVVQRMLQTISREQSCMKGNY